MFMRRIFLPVGQGAFYCERFTSPGPRINIVYDCGTLSDMNALQREVDREFGQDDIIDAVFISHLHEDHFNGLGILLKKCKIRSVYLPHMETLDLRLMQLDYVTRKRMSSDNTNVNDGLLADSILEDAKLKNDADLERGFKEALRESIKQESNEHSSNERSDIAQIDFKFVSDQKEEYINVGQLYGDWRETIFNSWRCKAFCITSRDAPAVQEVIDELKKICGYPLGEVVADDVLAKELGNKIESIKAGKTDEKDPGNLLEKIRDIYDKAYAKAKGKKTGTGEFNVNSLVLYSGCDNRSGLAVVRRPTCCYGKSLNGNMCSHPAVKVGCLYTGDCDAKDHWDNLYGGLTLEEWQTIGCIQIPHHGSERSFNEKFLDNNPFPGPATCHVISAGLGNGYKHPSESVIKMYNQRRCFPIVVTQDPGSLAEWCIQKPECVPWPRYYYDLPEYWTMRFYRGLYP